MPRTKLTDQQIAEFKAELVDAATRLFVNHGYAGVTMRAIARELTCSPMKAYRYFGDKDEVFAMVRTAAYQSFGKSQQEAYFSASDPTERLTALGRAYYDYATKNQLQYRLMFELLQPNPDGYPELSEASRAAMTPLRTVVSELIAQGTLKGDTDLITNAIWSGVHGVVSLHLAGKLLRQPNISELEETMMASVFLGLKLIGDNS
ncbi:MAG: TetR/AcrR family transcriptional regulator [Gammaproteobacteria bacterium]|jgi:AcrR family transcriptional regulator|nr:TetR/AcrR family transcriptional regulator [Gammaproteobacteria bacterium]